MRLWSRNFAPLWCLISIKLYVVRYNQGAIVIQYELNARIRHDSWKFDGTFNQNDFVILGGKS